MKFLCSLLLAFSIIAAKAQTGSWVPVWSDEFEYQGLPDENKWSYETGCSIRNSEAQYYTSKRLENTRVENGNLIIEARNEVMNGCNYTSGSINTRYKGDWLYGKIEVRAKLPKGRGMWPAIWMMSTDETYGNWPRSGEMDLMENVGYEPNKIHMNIHTEAYNHSIGTNKGGSATFADVYDTYHVYALEWTETKLDFLIDGTKRFTFDKESNDYKVWPFNKSFYLILNIAVGGSWGGSQGIDNAIFPQKMLVDYVRVFKWQTNPGPYTLEATASNGGTVKISPESNAYAASSSVTLTATPLEGFKFLGWRGDIKSKANPLIFDIYDHTSVRASFLPLCELVENGDFSENTAKWFLYQNDGASASWTAAGGSANITISTGGTNVWSTQLSQAGLPIEKGKKYELSFEASAEQNRTIRAGVGKNSDPYNTYYYTAVPLTPTLTKHTLSFTMTDSSDPVSKILFDVGANAADVTIDNVSLCEVKTTGGLEDTFEKDKAQIYFSQGKIVVNTTKIGRHQVKVMDIQGRTAFSGEVEGNGISILKLPPQLTSGIYLTYIQFENGESDVSRIIITP